ncbi:peptidoglycan-binding protein [Candidatus Campbellbacteria bacterium]|nr:MAG: peptidoglycan-binding protein [Candidatus Campbellbacteria bacterium]
MNFQFSEGVDPNKPIYVFKNDLKFSAIVSYGNPDVVALQNCLKFLGLFPVNTESTGYFGSITKSGVKDFQRKFGLIQDGVVGLATRSKFNELFK